MTYEEARRYIDSLKPRGISPGLDSITELCRLLGNPQNKIKTIHIAGTNGKGSTGAFLYSILHEAGNKVARFVSPAVDDYLEMFTVNGMSVSEDDYVSCVIEIKKAIRQLERKNIYPTSFEAETAIAFMLFSNLNADFSLIECGMGGRLDSTNIINPVMSVITSISEDHKNFLGDSLSDIAFEKSGIIKPYTPVVTCIQDIAASSVIEGKASAEHAPLYIAPPAENIVYTERTSFTYMSNDYTIPLMGTYQVQNASLAIQCALLLNIDNKAIECGLINTRWQFRFERIKAGGTTYILDGAHNEGAAKELAKSLKEYITDGKTAFICGIFKDKEYDKIAELTAPYADIAYTISPPPPRGMDSMELAEVFKKHGLTAFGEYNTAEAIDRTLNKYNTVVIFGSLSILSEAKKAIEERSRSDAAL